MAAGIVKGAHLAIHAVDDDDRIADLFPFHETSGFGHFIDMRGEQPALFPQILLLEVVIFLTGVTTSRQVR